MDNKEFSKAHCTQLHNGIVFDNSCRRKCKYVCLSPYRKTPLNSYVKCDGTSGKWLTSFGEEPCIKSDSGTTKKWFDFGSNLPTENPFKYKNDFDLNDYKTNLHVPTYRPLDLNIHVPTFKPWDYKVPTVKPFNYEDSFSHSSSDNSEVNSAPVAGVIVAGIIALTILLVFMRLSIARCAARRRQRRIQQLVGQLNSQLHQAREIRAQRQTVTPPQSPTEGTNSEHENEEEGIVIVIRRFFSFPLLRNPYNAFRNPPEPPPYDAESVPPPAYEETEGSNRLATDTNQQVADSEVSFTERSDTPADPPPPYTANIV